MAFPKASASTLWLKSRVSAQKTADLNELKINQCCKENLSNIEPELCQKLVDGSQKHLVEVQLAKGHLNKH